MPSAAVVRREGNLVDAIASVEGDAFYDNIGVGADGCSVRKIGDERPDVEPVDWHR